MKITVHRGKNQIGGNIVEIATDTTKILFDVGLDLNENNNKELPKIEGLFDRKGYDAVFISHYHCDHVGLAYSICKDIPLYIGEASYRIIKASDDYKGNESLHPSGFLHNGVKISVGDISICPYLCDHSAFDSFMLLCEADGETVLYTGDFRSNGRKPFDRLLNQLPDHIDKLICEGTTLSREAYVSETEKELEEKAVELFKKTDGPIFILQSTMNIDRIVTMYRAAKRNSRIFLEDVYMADIASAAASNIPNPSFEDVYVFITNPSRYKQLCKYNHKIGKSQLKDRKFVMCVRTSMKSYLEKLSEQLSLENGLLVYSFWSGYKETEDMQEFLSVCKNMRLKIATLHTSGHADAKTIEMLIDKVKPKEIIPIHTENSEWFEKYKMHE